MFNIPVGMEYVLPPPAVMPDIPAVSSVDPYKRTRNRKDRDKEGSKNRKKTPFKELLKKEAEEEVGRMGCFFETRV